METKTFEHETKTQKIHTYENEELYPFAILEETTSKDIEETTYKVVLGNKFCDEKVFDNLKECENYIASKPYSLMIALNFHLHEMLENIKAQQEILKKGKTNKTQENETK